MSRRHSYFFICAFSSFFSFFFFFNDTATTEIYTLSLHDALPILLGSLHHLFRLLGRYRPLGHADLGDPVSVPLGVAHRGVPHRGGDDGVRRDDRGPLPPDPYRSPVVLLLAQDRKSVV